MSLKTKLWIDFYLGSILHLLAKPFVILLGKALERNHDLSKCEEITYFKLLGGGSLVVAYPSLLALRRNPRIKKLRVVVTKNTEAFARSLGVFDEILVIRDDNILSLMGDTFSVISRLFRTDAVVDLEIHSRLSTFLCLLTMARNRIGAYTADSFWRRGLSTHLLFYNKFAGVYLFYDQVAELFGSTPVDMPESIASFRAHVGAEKAAVDASADDIAVAPICSDFGKERMLPWEKWPDILGPALLEKPRRVHLLGAPGDKAALDKLAGLIHEKFPAAEVVNHAGKLTLIQSIRLLSQVGTLYCIDSALLHFARLLGVATVSFWGPTDPATRLKPPISLDVIHYHRIACSPCVHLADEAPCKGNNICMQFAVDPNCGLDPNPIWLAENPQAGKNSGGGGDQ